MTSIDAVAAGIGSSRKIPLPRLRLFLAKATEWLSTVEICDYFPLRRSCDDSCESKNDTFFFLTMMLERYVYLVQSKQF